MSSCLVPTQSSKFLPDAGAGSHRIVTRFVAELSQGLWLARKSVGSIGLCRKRLLALLGVAPCPKLWPSPAVLAQLQQVRPQATQMGKKYWEVAEISDGFRWLCRS